MASAFMLSSTLPLLPAYAVDDDKPVVTPLAEPGTVVEQEDDSGSKKKKKSKSGSSKSKKKKSEETVKEIQEDLPKAADAESKDDAAKDATKADNKEEKAPEAAAEQSDPKAESAETKDTTANTKEEKSAVEKTEATEPKEEKTEETATGSQDEHAAKKPKKSGSKPSQSIAEADELLLNHKYWDAEKAYRALLDTDENGDAHAGLAVALARQNNANKVIEAEQILRKGREEFSDNPNMMAAAGYVSYIHSKTVASPAKRDLYLEAAETLSKRAVKSNPDISIAQQTLGAVRLLQDDAEGAIGPLRKACELALNPQNLAFLAEALLKTDPKNREARELVDQALEMNPKNWSARLQKAFILTNSGKHEDAFVELQSIPKDQRGSEWNNVQGDIYRKQGDGPSALASWKESNRLDPRNAEPYKRLAEYYAVRGDGELAIAEMHNALEILPNDLNLRSRLAELALRQDKLDVAEQEYRTILAVKQDDASALLGLSRVYFRTARKEGQYPQGWQNLMEQLQNVMTEQSVKGEVVKGAKNLKEKIQLSEAEKALTQNRFREARQIFSQVINTHKEEPYELLTLGEQAFNDGDLKSAEQAFTYARELPDVAPRAEQGISKIVSQRNEAVRQTKLGDATLKIPEVAVDHYKQALIADPQYPEAYYGLFNLFYRTKNETDKAIDYALCFLEASDEENPLRKEVETNLSKLKKSRKEK
ncbi:MAG: tetratricopeptide repeat protein [Candidatus Melainabacteria bacterium]|nr:tetratricopeptide repeat protein [Candidatus Melainabacteria bacterium]